MTRKSLEALLFGIIGALIVQIGIAATSNQYTVPTNSPPWLNTALEITQSISANVTATTMTQASIPNTYTSYFSNYFDFSGPFLQNGNGLQIGNSLTAQGFSAGVFVNEPSSMSNPLLLLGFNNSLMFTVSAGGNVTAAGNISGSSIGFSKTPITGSTLTLSATNITTLTVPYSSSYTHSIQIGANSMSVAYPGAALFISVPTSVGNTSIPLAISDKNGGSLFTVDTTGNISAAGYVNGSSIGFSKTPIMGSTLTLSANNITTLTLPYVTSAYIHSLQIGNSDPGSDNSGAALFISVPSTGLNIPFAIVNTSGKALFNVDRSGNVSAVDGKFSGNVSANKGSFSGDVSTSGNISANKGSFSGNVTINGTGGNVPHNCVIRSQNSSNSTITAACNSGEIAVGGGGSCYYYIKESVPAAVSGNTPTEWVVMCSQAAPSTYVNEAVVVCCQE